MAPPLNPISECRIAPPELHHHNHWISITVRIHLFVLFHFYLDFGIKFQHFSMTFHRNFTIFHRKSLQSVLFPEIFIKFEISTKYSKKLEISLMDISPRCFFRYPWKQEISIKFRQNFPTFLTLPASTKYVADFREIICNYTNITLNSSKR